MVLMHRLVKNSNHSNILLLVNTLYDVFWTQLIIFLKDHIIFLEHLVIIDPLPNKAGVLQLLITINSG